MKPIDKAIFESGLNQAQFAKAIGYHESQVSHWVTERKPVPPRACLAIESLPGVTVTAHDLRPKIFVNPPKCAG